MDPLARRKRLQAGGASVLVAPVAAWFLHEYAGVKDMPDHVAMSLGALLGAFLSWMALCANDMRSIVTEYYRRKLLGDRRGK